MPKYHVLKVDGLGDLDFYGNLGAVAQFEDKQGISISEMFKEGKAVKLSSSIGLIYECHIVACLRLNKEPIPFNTFKAYTDNSFLDLLYKLMDDIAGETKGVEKKT